MVDLITKKRVFKPVSLVLLCLLFAVAASSSDTRTYKDEKPPTKEKIYATAVFLDLDGDGVELLNVKDSKVFFDIDGDGYLEKLSWVGPDDGVLVFDKDRSDDVNGWDEVSFSGYLERAVSSLQGVTAMDTNWDNHISEFDKGFTKFYIWQDANSNGLQEFSELLTFSELDIISIDTKTDLISETIGDNFSFGTGKFLQGSKFSELKDVYLGRSKHTFLEDSHKREHVINLSNETLFARKALEDGVGIDEYSDAINRVVGSADDDFINLKNAISTADLFLVYAGKGDDQATGSSLKDYILGQDGNDLIYGDENDDTLFGGQGDDEISGGLGDDKMYGELGADLLGGGLGDDFISGGDGKDYINGGDGDDQLYGDSGSDSIFAGSGNDVLAGGTGNDYLGGESGNDFLIGGEGPDELYGGKGNDLLVGGSGADFLAGGDGDDKLIANAGEDSLTAGNGNDYLDGGSGSDAYYVSGSGTKVIQDYLGKSSDVNKIHFGQVVTLSDLTFSVDGSDLNVAVGEQSNALIRGYFNPGRQDSDILVINGEELFVSDVNAGFECRGLLAFRFEHCASATQ